MLDGFRAEARRVRRWPFCFKVAALLLAASLLGGQWLQRQHGGAVTRRVMQMASAVCPAAAPAITHLTVADGARVLDRTVLAAAFDWNDGGNRCRERTRVIVPGYRGRNGTPIVRSTASAAGRRACNKSLCTNEI